jgi:putative acetyltransferase
MSRRLAEPRDLDAVFAIYMDDAVVPFLGHDPMSLDAFHVVFDALVGSRSFFVFEHEGELAGFYKTTRFPGRASHVVQLGTLAVAPRFQGRGVAQAMLDDAVKRLRKAGVKRIELIVESDNPRGLAFYRRQGFEQEGTLKKFYKRSDQDHYVDDHVLARVFD